MHNRRHNNSTKAITYLLIISAFIVIPFNGFTKKFIPNYLKNRPITIVKGDTSMVFTVTDKELKKPDKKLMYHYYFHREKGKSRGSYLGNLLHGKYTCFQGNGKLIEQGEYKNGLKMGYWYTWHINGEISSKTKWKYGLPNGKKTEFDVNGNTISQYEWKDKQWKLIVKKDRKQIKENRKLEKEQKKLDSKAKAEQRKLQKAKSKK